MTTALPAVFQPQVLAAQMDYARALAESNLLPKQYHRQPANLLWAISYGQTLGVDPMTAVQSIHVINGRPTASADLIAGLVRRAGHKLRVTGDDRQAVAQIIRADDPGFTFEVTWTWDRAVAAKLTGKDTWKQFPAAMLKARAVTEVARAACSEILQGTIYTPEELGAEVDEDGTPVLRGEVVRTDAAPQLQRQAPGQDAWETAAPAPAVQQTPPDVVAAGIADVPPESLTPAGRDYLHEAMAAPDAATVRLIWQDARAEGARPGYLDQIAEVGKGKAAAEQQAAAQSQDAPAVSPEWQAAAADVMAQAPAAEPVADTLPGAPATAADRLGALAMLYAAGEAAGLSQVETRQVLADTCGKSLSDATAEDIAAVAADLRTAGGAR
jgi:hypothetical protein